MNDTELIEELRDLLQDESDATCAPSSLAARSRALHRRRRARLAIAGAVPVVVAGAVLAGVLSTGASQRRGSSADRSAPVALSPGRPASHEVSAQPAAYITRRVKAALAHDTNEYIKERTTTAMPRNHVIIRTWIDPVTSSVWTIQYQQPLIGAGSKDYHVRDDYQHSLYRSIDYTNQTWTEQEDVFGPIGKSTPPAYAGHPSFDSADAAIRKAVDRGQIKLIGKGTIEGYPALDLDLGTSAYGPSTMWVYADTYHPLQIRFDRHFYETWLPRTAVTIARADPTIPHRFTYVPPSDFR
jgi:hypothetical protein